MRSAEGQQTKPLYEFGSFRLDPEERALLREGRPVPLTIKAFETLLVLVESHGHVIEKGELMRRVWPDSFVEENNLAQNISLLRKVLGENGGPSLIETVPRRGYRFVADVRERRGARDLLLVEHVRSKVIIEEEEESADDHAAAGPSANGQASAAAPSQTVTPGQDEAASLSVAPAQALSASSSAEAPRHATHLRRIVNSLKQRKTFLAAAIILLALTAVVIAYFVSFRRGGRERVVGSRPRSIAILPFRNLRRDAETDFLGTSLADTIVTKLGFIKSLIVRPTAYVEKYRDREIDPRRVAEELDVDTLLMGSYLKDGENLRVTAQLVDVGRGEILWRDTIDVRYDRLLTVEDRVAQEVIKGLQLNISPEEAERLKLDAPQNALAYEDFLRGRYLISTNDHQTAIKLLEESVRLDPNYALAWTYLGKAYSVTASQYFGGREFNEKAQAAYDRALALNPEKPETRVMIANFLTENNRVEEAVPILRGVIETNPNHPFAHWELSYAYRYAGMLDDSILEGERALQLYLHLTGHLFNSYLYAGQYEKFIESLPPRDDAYTLFYRGLGYYYLGDKERAAVNFDRAYELDPTPLVSQIGRALKLSGEGRGQEALALLKKAERRIEEGAGNDGEMSYKMAQAFAVLGDKGSALRWMRRGIEQGFFCYPYFANDPLLMGLRDEAEYAKLLEEARQRHEEFKRRFF